MRISVNVTLPKNIVNTQAFINALADAQRNQTGPGIKRLFEKTVDGWRDKPVFRQKQTITSSRISMLVYADGGGAKIYGLVNAGSPPHPITPRNTRVLSFRPGYRAGTQPRVLSSRPYLRSGEYVTAGAVSHPGFAAREFDLEIGKQYEPIFAREMQEAIKGL